MSYDVAIITPPIPAQDAAVWQSLESMFDSSGPTPDVFRSLHARIIAKYPCISSLADDQIDESVWSSGPIWTNFGNRAAILNLVHSRAKEVVPFLIEAAWSLNLVLVDLSRDEIHRPDGVKGLTLTLEDKPAQAAPTVAQVAAAVDALTPNGGPGFLILEGHGDDYTQAAGGAGVYTAEWREYSGQEFRHWVAGLPGIPSELDVEIPTNGFEVTVKENEQLGPTDVKEIMTAYATKVGRPQRFVWRDVTDRFK